MSVADIRQSGAMRMDQEEIERLLLDEGVGVLALPARDAPYVLPLSFGYDGDSCLYFTYLLFGTHSKKEELSERAETARFLVYSAASMYDWRSVLLTGTVDEVSDWNELRAAMENAWHPNLFAAATPMRGLAGYRFRITDRSGIKHSSEDVRA